MAKILPFVHPDACTWEEAVESGLEIYGPGELPPGVEESDLVAALVGGLLRALAVAATHRSLHSLDSIQYGHGSTLNTIIYKRRKNRRINTPI